MQLRYQLLSLRSRWQTRCFQSHAVAAALSTMTTRNIFRTSTSATAEYHTGEPGLHLLPRVVADDAHFQAHERRGGVHLNASALHELQLLRVESQEAKVVHLANEAVAIQAASGTALSGERMLRRLQVAAAPVPV